MILAIAVNVISGDLSRGVDALHEGVDTAWGIDRGVGTAALEEALKVAVAVLIISGNLSGVVCAHGVDKDAAWRIDHRVGIGCHAPRPLDPDERPHAVNRRAGPGCDTHRA